jgi:hypothetical protein
MGYVLGFHDTTTLNLKRLLLSFLSTQYFKKGDIWEELFFLLLYLELKKDFGVK